MTRLATICARGGSKGLPNKNVRLLAGRPLIAWTILQARASGLFDAVVVSSDSAEIRTAAMEAGADAAFDRCPELSSDTAPKAPAIHDAMLRAEAQAGRRYDLLVDLDATAPLRVPDDIRGAVGLLENSGCKSVITGSPARRSPYFNLVERRADGTVGISKQAARLVMRRQDAPACFDMNASVYVWRRDAFASGPRVFYPDTRLYEMPAERSHDIDSELDWEIVAILFERLGISATCLQSQS